MANKAYKYRIYPNEAQKIQLARTFGCVRFVYNKCLDEQKRRHDAGEKHLSKMLLNSWCTNTLKKTHTFLKEVDKFALNNAIFNLDAAYNRFFNHLGGFPKYKSLHKSKASYTTNFTNGNIVVTENNIKLPKLGRVKAVIHRSADLSWALKSATVSMEKDGTYYASVLYEYNISYEPMISENAIGLDYKSNGLYMDSNGNCPGSPKYYRKSADRLSKEQRRLSRKVKGSHNYEKQKIKVAKVHKHIANQRKDFLHKLSTEIANRYNIVCVEDLNMQSISNKGFGNGKATMDNGYGMFLNMLEYKLQDRGGMLIKVDKWFPSTQTCSNCGHIQKMELSERTYICPECGTIMDRDQNAAINILNEGLKTLEAA